MLLHIENIITLIFKDWNPILEFNFDRRKALALSKSFLFLFDRKKEHNKGLFWYKMIGASGKTRSEFFIYISYRIAGINMTLDGFCDHTV